jgi:hypothetical protein
MKTKRLFIDQYGTRFYAFTVKELRGMIGMGGGRVSRMYNDDKNGNTYKTGYVIGGHWLTEYRAHIVKA